MHGNETKVCVCLPVLFSTRITVPANAQTSITVPANAQVQFQCLIIVPVINLQKKFEIRIFCRTIYPPCKTRKKFSPKSHSLDSKMQNLNNKIHFPEIP
jgi:hypothetical protein